ncbi:type I restriction enzyme S subunit [Paraburkholderia sp. Clong3]|uniref:restriction endonuclease subunit S n=1 Tax=Paraburkholderia sp. Clong3 TaxID=2991061 RepID=UPI003D1F85C6
MKVVLENIQKGLYPNAIPAGWGLTQLKELSLTKISNGAFNDPKKVGTGYKLINIVDLYKGSQIRADNLGRLSLSEAEYKTFKVQRGDLFFTRSSLKKEGIAHCNIFLSDDEGVVYECHMMRVRPSPHLVDSKYLQEFCLAGPAREYFISHGKTTTMTTIDQGSIGGLPVLLPPLPEQQKIAAILTALDDKLDVIARQIAAAQTLEQGLMQTLFNRGVGTQDADGCWVPHTEFKDSEAGEIPVGWDVRTLERVANVERGKFSARPRNDPKYFEAGNIPFIQTGDIASSTRFVGKASQFLNLEGLEVSKLFPVGTIFITIAANIGDVAIAKIPMACPDSVVGINVIAEACDGTWLYYLLKNSKDYFDSRATQNAQKNINLQVLRPFLFALPPMLEQQRVAEILSSLDDKLDVLSSKQTQYQALKRGLMQKLLTGEWRVKLDTPEEAIVA